MKHIALVHASSAAAAVLYKPSARMYDVYVRTKYENVIRHTRHVRVEGGSTVQHEAA